MNDERKIAAAKADKYIGRDGSEPKRVGRSKDAALLAYLLSSAPPSMRAEGFAALSRVTGLPRRAIEQMGDDIPF